MAGKKKGNTPMINVELLASAGNGIGYATKAELEHLINNNPVLIEKNDAMVSETDPNKIAFRLTDAGKQYLTEVQSKADNTNQNIEKGIDKMEKIVGAVLPPVKRGRGAGGAGAPTKYDFTDLAVGESRFYPVTDAMKDPVKALGSVVSKHNTSHATVISTEMKEVQKRGKGNKPETDAEGKPIMVQREVKKYKFTKRWRVAPVKSGVAYGSWTAPADGALVIREPDPAA